MVTLPSCNAETSLCNIGVQHASKVSSQGTPVCTVSGHQHGGPVGPPPRRVSYPLVPCALSSGPVACMPPLHLRLRNRAVSMTRWVPKVRHWWGSPAPVPHHLVDGPGPDLAPGAPHRRCAALSRGGILRRVPAAGLSQRTLRLTLLHGAPLRRIRMPPAFLDRH